MALTRVTNFVAGGLGFADLNSEFNNYRDYINNKTLANPLAANLDFGDSFTVSNLRTFWTIRNGAEYGTTDTGIQAAIDSFNVGERGIVFLPPGTYDFTGSVELKSGITLMGSGSHTILSRASGFTASSGVGMLTVASGATDVAIQNLQIDAQQTDNSSAGLAGIDIRGGQRIWVDRCYIRRFGDTSETTTPANDGIYVTNNAGTESKQVYITNCYIGECVRNGISVVDGDNIHIIGNHVTCSLGTSNHGIDFESNAGGVITNGVISGNTISGWRNHGIVTFNNSSSEAVTADGRAMTISNNVVENCQGRAILVKSMQDVAVTGNTCYSNMLSAIGGSGGSIDVWKSLYVEVNGNTVRNSGNGGNFNSDGISVVSTGTDRCAWIGVGNNIVEGSSRHGILVSAGDAGSECQMIGINGNKCRNNGRVKVSASEIDIQVANATATTANINIVGNSCSLDGLSPADPHSGVRFEDFSSGGTIGDMILVGNDLRNSFSGAGAAVGGRDVASNLEEGHNLTLGLLAGLL
jgi:hypothetical protein